MKGLGQNGKGYERAGVKEMEGFRGLKGRFLVQHGTGDDNVHFQNTAVLAGRLMEGGVGPERLELAFFVDSDHGIRFRGQNGFLYKQLSRRLWEERRREGSGGGHQWSRRDVVGQQG